MELCYQLKIRFINLLDLTENNSIYERRFLAKNMFVWACLLCLLSPKLLIAESWTDLCNSSWEAKSIAPSMVKVVDGDTFYVDWNRNKYTESEEKIRLLFVDTSELNQSHKGQD